MTRRQTNPPDVVGHDHEHRSPLPRTGEGQGEGELGPTLVPRLTTASRGAGPHPHPLPRGGEGAADPDRGAVETGGAAGAADAAPPLADGEPADLRLSESDREIVAAEARAVAAALQDQERRRAYQHLAAEAEEGRIPAALLRDLERLLDLGLQSGRFRGRYGPGGETAMARLYGRTPGGVEVTKRVAEVNAALAELAGQPLESLSFSLAGWGAYALQVRTDRYSLRLRIDATGVQAESLEASA